MKLPTWAMKNTEKYGRRIIHEHQMLEEQYPLFELQMQNQKMYAEGVLITGNRNIYKVRVCYPDDYPNSPPIAYILDKDVMRDSSVPHTYGVSDSGDGTEGLRICVLNPHDSVGQSWQPNFSVVTIIHLAVMWLHAYEVWKVKGIWSLPEH